MSTPPMQSKLCPPDSAQDGDTKNITFARNQPSGQSSSSSDLGTVLAVKPSNLGNELTQAESINTSNINSSTANSSVPHSAASQANAFSLAIAGRTTEQPLPIIAVEPSPAPESPIPRTSSTTTSAIRSRRGGSYDPFTTTVAKGRVDGDDGCKKETNTRPKHKSAAATAFASGEGKESEDGMKTMSLMRSQSTLNELESSNQQLIEQLSDNRSQNDELRRRVDALLEQLRANEQRLGSELNTERETLKRERKLSTEKIAQLEEELKAARIDCTNKDKKLVELKETSKAKSSHLQTEVDSANAETERIREERERLLEARDRLNSELQNALMRLETLSATLAAERLAAEERIREEIERQTITNDYIDGLYQQMDEMQNEVDHLRTELERNEAELAGYRSTPWKQIADCLGSDRSPRPPPRF